MVYRGDISIVNGVYKPINITFGGHHLASILLGARASAAPVAAPEKKKKKHSECGNSPLHIMAP